MLVGDGETMRSNSVDEMTNKPKRKAGKKNTMKHRSQCGKTRRVSFILFFVSVLSLLMSLLHSRLSNWMISLMLKKSIFCLPKSCESVILMMCM